MSKEPQKPVPAEPAAPVETLEDAVYRSSLSAGNEAIKRGNPRVTIPTTILMYGLFAFVAVQLAKQTDAGKKVIKSVGIDLAEKPGRSAATPATASAASTTGRPPPPMRHFDFEGGYHPHRPQTGSGA